MASLSGHLPNMRRMYRAHPGCKLIGADLSQIELWVMAAISGDPVLLRNLLTGDVYTEDAKFLFQDDKGVPLPSYLTKCVCDAKCLLPDKHLKPKARKDAKVTHLACQYYIMLDKFYRLMLLADQSCTFDRASKLYANFHKLYVAMFAWGQEECRRVRRNGYALSRMLGTKKTYPVPATIQEAMNWPVQTTAAEVFARILLTLGSGIRPRWGQKPGLLWTRFGGKARLVKHWYDAVYVEADDDVANDVQATVSEVMSMPMVIDGKDWRFRHEVKQGVLESDV